jgi:hypothetical protein
MEALGPVLLLLSIPLALGWVPPNRFYGFRVAATLKDKAIWYDVNIRAGCQFLMLGALMVALELVLPSAARNITLRTVGMTGLALISISNWRRANRLRRSSPTRSSPTPR